MATCLCGPWRSRRHAWRSAAPRPPDRRVRDESIRRPETLLIGASRSVVKGNFVGFADEELGKMTLAHARFWHSHQRGPTCCCRSDHQCLRMGHGRTICSCLALAGSKPSGSIARARRRASPCTLLLNQQCRLGVVKMSRTEVPQGPQSGQLRGDRTRASDASSRRDRNLPTIEYRPSSA